MAISFLYPGEVWGTTNLGKRLVLFYGPSILSNFAQTPFDLEGESYNCVEQYYQVSRLIVSFG